MNPSNLPPGVTDSMLPGNRPEDIDFDSLMDWICDKLIVSELTTSEIKRAVLMGIAGVQAEGKEIGIAFKQAIKLYSADKEVTQNNEP